LLVGVFAARVGRMGRVAVAEARVLGLLLRWAHLGYVPTIWLWAGVVLRSAAPKVGRPSLGAGCLPSDPEEALCHVSLGGHGLIAGSGEASLKNTGVVEKTEGSATTMQVEFAFDNEGKVSVTAGKLEFTEGGVSGEKAVGSWSTSGAETEIVFNANGPTFALGATVPLTGAFEIAHGTVTAGKIEGSAASVTISGVGLAGQGTLDVTGASASTLQNLTTTDREGRGGGVLEGPDEVDITGSLTGGGFGTLKGPGTTVIEPGATGTVGSMRLA
jgi:hypothetical protein